MILLKELVSYQLMDRGYYPGKDRLSVIIKYNDYTRFVSSVKKCNSHDLSEIITILIRREFHYKETKVIYTNWFNNEDN